jgi:uncharacterized protein
MGLIASNGYVNSVKLLNKTQQAASVLAVCVSILLSGIFIAYKPGSDTLSEFRFPTGVPPALGSSSTTKVGEGTVVEKTFSISGLGVVYAKADKAIVTLGAYTEDKLASKAIDENAALMTSVIKALKAMGFTDDDIQTTGYSVYPNYNWEVRQVISYQVTNMIQVKVTDLDKVGDVIDTATGAGANRVDNVSFGLKDETSAKMKLDAYKSAIADAKAKSDVITSGLGISIKGVQSVSESSYSSPIYYGGMDYAGISKSSTPIMNSNLSVTVTLNIVYLIE